MSVISVTVAKKTREAEDIVSFELVGVDGAPLPPFSAGAHIDVKVNDRITRQYSLCNSASEPHRYLIGVLKEPNSRGGSVVLHDVVEVGDTLEVSTPKNHFPLEPAPHTLLLAGGIGVTPILCMAERLAETHADFHMHYCARSRERAAFVGRIANSSFARKVSFHFDDGAQDQKLDLPAVMRAAPAGTHVYACGPAGFIEFVKNTATMLGWNSERVHFEYFGAAPDVLAPGGEFEVKVASTGACYLVPSDRTVVQVLRDAGIDIPVSCEQGVCGTCITRILEGEPEHRDLYFTDEERAANDQFAPCCSRSRSRLLVLDV